MPHRLDSSSRRFSTLLNRPSMARVTARKGIVALAALASIYTFAGPSRAQEGGDTVGGSVPSHIAVVLDFEVGPGLDPILGRKAADAVAVEMEDTGVYEVVTRQAVEKRVAERRGLLPPYVPQTQRRLGAEMGARSVITGRITTVYLGPYITETAANGRTTIDPRIREARVQLQIRQLEVRSGDYVNGTQVTETTTDELAEVDDDVLINQSIDKAAYSAVRTVRLITFPEATVMHTTAKSLELNLGFRNGIRPGQRFSILRDSAIKPRGLNESTVTVERVKVAEMVIDSVDNDQSIGHIVSGGSVGVRTNDKARRIFAPGLPFTEPSFEQGSRLNVKK
jgi:hypothetical protein